MSEIEPKKKVIIDTDPGTDDALALALLAGSEKIDILAVTTVAGNNNIQDVTDNAKYVLDLIDRNIPLYSGANKPLHGRQVSVPKIGSGRLLGSESSKADLNGLAVRKIIELASLYPNEVSVLAIGPHTNIAAAFQERRDLPDLIKEVVLMGGAFEVPGNMSRVAELNIFVDPEAAKIVFEAPVKKTMVPLETCYQVSLLKSDFDEIKGYRLFEPLTVMIDPYMEYLKENEDKEGILVYDALAAYYLIYPEASTVVQRDVVIETEGTYTRGMTIPERRSWVESNPNVDVVTYTEIDVFREDFFNHLKSV